MGQQTTLDLFADELRRARAAAGMSQDALSHVINYSSSLVAKIELGQRRPRRDFAQRCDEALETGGLLVRIHAVLGHGPVQPWFRQWAAIEQEATSLRSYEWSVVPGLLQIEAYARTLLGGGALLIGDEVEQQVAVRLERQDVLLRDRPPHFIAVIDEHVLRQPIGGAEVMRDQLCHLIKVCTDHPRVRIQIVPRAVGAYVGLNGPFVIATPPDGDDVAYLDDQLQGQLIDRVEDVATIQRAWESVRGEALPHQQSMELIREAAGRWN
ncbi:helix-turn-helix transcriptional regulator [Micromonospora sp. NPDC049679]|uniref:helix-turn-helix domain-containing protein n=1 Tax=Micromonospora sp. NPDC049679 TaxID=3155920 RepID=UPI0033CCE4B5